MTICIGAICDKGTKDGEKVIVASDRMITGRAPPVTYEPKESKIVKITESFVVLTAGSAIAHTELLNDAIPILEKEKTPIASGVARILSLSYQSQRIKKMGEKFLRPRGYNIESFYKNIRNLPPEIALTLDRRIETYDYNLEILLAGVDDQGGHLYDIDNPGVTNCMDALGHHEIGSGIIQARTIFTSAGYTPRMPLNEALFLVYQAKRSAEVAPGVGKEIDMAIVKSSITDLDKQIMKKLEEVYNEMEEVRKSSFEGMKGRINTLLERGR